MSVVVESFVFINTYSWVERLMASRPELIVLRHCVTGSKSADAEPVTILRCDVIKVIL